ncbi:sugar ABC transporter ATP-binding protein [Phyllobacterium sp. P30BS-XVII]|uniref:sugar ABC transporter ATP-binding protein n=1 Tax=Phyllobacterium sp. P30BS-XVII TaxID=2587046 RepID=UPI0015FE3CB8|nr:sugar ABC transporter ATP-binding protein [Phyllobacterium sp. P30BS-XVII]MBA8901726.1 ribose transport system ATP-binding protein [Phyllobacterium sp. P30BS-XVII]
MTDHDISHRSSSGQSEDVSAAAAHLPILELRGLEKQYLGTHALKPADLAFKAGEIHAIVGENGAGKSTLIKLLTGVIPRTAGEILFRGEPVALTTPLEAIQHGINAVHQEVVLCPHLTVAANIFLGEEQRRFGLLQHRHMIREAQKILDDLGFALPAHALLSDLTIGQQQLIATARAATRGARFLIFDEPTAYLTREEAAQLFALIRRLQKSGVTIVYISHRMEEVFELADRVSILRDGRLVGTRNIEETNENELIGLMINRSIEQIYHKVPFTFGKTILETQNLSGNGFEDISLSVREGEIVGLYGLIGAGRSEFVTTIFGRHPKTSGQILWDGKEVRIERERDAIKLGIALAPESRRDQGLCLSLPVSLNLNLPIYKQLSRNALISHREEARHADNQISDLRIKTSSRSASAASLSGGNQQKIVIGKWLNHGAKLFIFDEPTVGVDVGTKAEIYRLFSTLLENGAGIILISSYLPEVFELADTLHVFRRGHLVASHPHKSVTHEDILTQALGSASADASTHN